MGQILSAGHFWQPATMAMGQRVIWVLQGSVRAVWRQRTASMAAAVANLATAVTLGTCINITACKQMATGSSYLNSLNAGPDVISPVKYVSIYSALDEVVFPASTAALKDGATNVKVQSQCPLRTVGHLGLIADGTVYSGVDDALANRSITLSCLAV